MFGLRFPKSTIFPCFYPTSKYSFFGEFKIDTGAWKNLIFIFMFISPICYAWRGGVSLSKETNFNSYVVTKEEYDEVGSQIHYEKFDL